MTNKNTMFVMSIYFFAFGVGLLSGILTSMISIWLAVVFCLAALLTSVAYYWVAVYNDNLLLNV